MKEVVIWMYYYFNLLRDTNKNLIKIIGTDCIDSNFTLTRDFCDLMSQICILVPRKPYFGTKTKEERKDGIRSFTEQLNGLDVGINKILDMNKRTFHNIRKIRNKNEHEPHFLQLYTASSGSDTMTNISIKYVNPNTKKDIVAISTKDLIQLIKQVNNLYDNIMEQILNYLNICDDEEFKTTYKKLYWRIKFNDYNEIYDSPILLNISRAVN